ncbi:MAG: hypothetical protein NTY19_32005, partial [Planctomycetota bacterium]|nr:hypothetical protein [Planctomycetota bacterium]
SRQPPGPLPARIAVRNLTIKATDGPAFVPPPSGLAPVERGLKTKAAYRNHTPSPSPHSPPPAAAVNAAKGSKGDRYW